MIDSSKQVRSRWFHCLEFRHFPFLHRLWLFWCAHGFKRASGGTLGGNCLFSLVKQYFLWRPFQGNNFIAVPVRNGGYIAVLDLLDFQTFLHTVPVLAKKGAERQVLEMLFRPGDTFVDIGANQGVFSLLAANLAGSAGRVYSYEPNSRLYQALQLSREVNGFRWMAVRDVALSDREGMADFYVPSLSSGVGSLFKTHAEQSSSSRQVRVPITTLDKEMEKLKPASIKLVKIDVEGNELHVIRGASAALTSFKPFLWFELNPYAQELAGVDQGDIFTVLKEYGYSSFYDIDRVVCGMEEEIGDVDKLTNVLAVPTGRIDLFRSLRAEWSRGALPGSFA